MPDVHWGIGATVGSVIATDGAIMPGGGRRRHRLRHDGRADEPHAQRSARRSAPRCARDRAAPCRTACTRARGATAARGSELAARRRRGVGAARAALRAHRREAPRIEKSNQRTHLGTLGTGNHFIEVCLDESGPRLGHAALGLARRRQPDRHATSSSSRSEDMRAPRSATCPTRISRICPRAREHFDDYVEAVEWAQDFALQPTAQLMMQHVLDARARARQASRRSRRTDVAVNCHHNYVAREHHYGADVFVTRKGAVRARAASSASSRAAWARARTSCAARATRRASRAAATARAARCRATRRSAASRVEDHAARDRRRRVPQGRRA